MKTRSLILFVLVCIGSILISADAYARDNRIRFSVADALYSDAAIGKLNPDIRLFFAGQSVPPIIKSFGIAKTNKKTNAFNKTDLVACEWVFISAVIQMQNKAQKLGANAVINIKSNYKNVEFASPDSFECGAGNVLAGVALKGEFVVTE